MQALITQFTTKTPESGKPYIAYHISCTVATKQWEVEKRYSDFERLREELYTRHESLPKLPPKLLFGNANAIQLQKRQMALQTYLDAIVNDTEVSKDIDVDSFLEISTHTEIPNIKSFMKENHNVMIALYDHEPRNEGELRFQRGDKLTITRRDGTTYYGALKSNPSHVGAFPSNYVQSVLTVNTIASMTPPTFTPLWEKGYEAIQQEKDRPIGKLMRLTVDYEYEKNYFDKVTLKVFDRVKIICPRDPDDTRKNCSYVRHIKKEVELWIPDECLWDLPQDD
jgi:hypothetical protein